MGSSKNTDIKTKINKKQEARIKIKSEKKLIFFFLRRNIIIKKNKGFWADPGANQRSKRKS